MWEPSWLSHLTEQSRKCSVTVWVVRHNNSAFCFTVVNCSSSKIVFFLLQYRCCFDKAECFKIWSYCFYQAVLLLSHFQIPLLPTYPRACCMAPCFQVNCSLGCFLSCATPPSHPNWVLTFPWIFIPYKSQNALESSLCILKNWENGRT